MSRIILFFSDLVHCIGQFLHDIISYLWILQNFAVRPSFCNTFVTLLFSYQRSVPQFNGFGCNNVIHSNKNFGIIMLWLILADIKFRFYFRQSNHMAVVVHKALAKESKKPIILQVKFSGPNQCRISFTLRQLLYLREALYDRIEKSKTFVA